MHDLIKVRSGEDDKSKECRRKHIIKHNAWQKNKLVASYDTWSEYEVDLLVISSPVQIQWWAKYRVVAGLWIVIRLVFGGNKSALITSVISQSSKIFQ